MEILGAVACVLTVWTGLVELSRFGTDAHLVTVEVSVVVCRVESDTRGLLAMGNTVKVPSLFFTLRRDILVNFVKKDSNVINKK